MTIRILGVIDEDPFDSRTWSGSSRYFFNALNDNGNLYRAISALPTPAIQALYKGLSFHPGMDKWKFKYHLNTGYFRQMTSVALGKINTLNSESFDATLQVGAWYNLSTVKNKLHASYHDGNLATRLSSPYGHPAISNRYIRKAFEYEKALYHDLDHIFPMSKWLADSFTRDFNVSHKKLHPVGAGINLPYIASPGNRDPERPRVLFVGKDFRRKGGFTLLEAFIQVRKKIKNAELVIAGPRLENLPDGVTCAGYIDKRSDGGIEKLLNLYSGASMFVLPSLYEPFGIALAEAMAHKLPCIGALTCAMPEIIDDGENGYLVEPGNCNDLANRIITLLSDESMRLEMGESAFSKYNNNYRWNLVTRRITSILGSNPA
jgi:glycosyltransferase involved in cell wall biosynthesis